MVIIEAHLFSQFLSYGIEEQSAAWALEYMELPLFVGRWPRGFYAITCIKENVGMHLWIPCYMGTLYLFLLPKTLFTAVVFAIGLGLTGDATVSPTSGIVNDTFTMKKSLH